MKLNAENTKKLNAVRKALLLGVPISSMMIAAGCSETTVDRKSPGINESVKPKEQAKKTVLIDQMSLSHRRFSTPGIFYPPNLVIQLKRYKAKAKDTWESLAKRHKTTVEIMLRINGIPIGTTWTVADSNVVPEKLKLVPGREINVPEKITYGASRNLSYDRFRRSRSSLTKEMERR